MEVKVCEPNDAHKTPIQNLYVFYRYDLMPFYDDGLSMGVNEHGVQPCSRADIRTHGEDNDEGWWAHPGVIWPMLIELDGKPAGFAIVGSGRFVHPEVNYRLYDFYVLNKYRRLGIAREAAFQTFDRFSGWWEIGWLPRNLPAANCWPKLVREYTGKDGEDWPYDDGLPGIKFYSPGHRV